VNTDLTADAAVVNTDPYGKGWIIKVTVEGPTDELMDAAAYKKLV
jgi:glycine cleavage system H protein